MSDYMLGKNPYQGKWPKVLFVCSGGILRSATAAHWAVSEKQWNARSCGCMDEAIPPVHPNLLEWADNIFVMESHHARHIIGTFGEKYADKIEVLDIPDNFAYRSEELVKLLEDKLASYASG